MFLHIFMCKRKDISQIGCKAGIFISDSLYKEISVKCKKYRACKFYETLTMKCAQRLAPGGQS
jgi:hypothetical protein